MLLWWLRSIKLLHSCHFPLGAVLSYFCTILCFVAFLMFLCFLITIQLLHITFFTDDSGITLRVNSSENLFIGSSSLLGAFDSEVFYSLFLRCSSIFENCSPSYQMKLCADIFCITVTVNVLRKISQHVFLCLGHYAVLLGLFWVYSSMT